MADEIQKPPQVANANLVAPNVNDNNRSNAPVLPAKALSVVEGTSTGASNANLEHVCDFISEMQKNINLKKYTKAIANKIREAIRYVMKALGFSDATGQYSWLIQFLKDTARELKRIQKEIIQPILDFEKYVVAYITKLRALVQWILSLPAKFKAMLQDCLQKILKLIATVFKDSVSGFGEGLSPGTNEELLAAAKEAASATVSLAKSSAAAITGAIAIPVSATAGLLVPVSQSDLDMANKTIAAYEQPSTTQATNPTPTQNKSAP
jgi:hypothetical protein